MQQQQTECSARASRELSGSRTGAVITLGKCLRRACFLVAVVSLVLEPCTQCPEAGGQAGGRRRIRVFGQPRRSRAIPASVLRRTDALCRAPATGIDKETCTAVCLCLVSGMVCMQAHTHTPVLRRYDMCAVRHRWSPLHTGHSVSRGASPARAHGRSHADPRKTWLGVRWSRAWERSAQTAWSTSSPKAARVELGLHRAKTGRHQSLTTK